MFNCQIENPPDTDRTGLQDPLATWGKLETNRQMFNSRTENPPDIERTGLQDPLGCLTAGWRTCQT
jgi:hypothetical protein